MDTMVSISKYVRISVREHDKYSYDHINDLHRFLQGMYILNEKISFLPSNIIVDLLVCPGLNTCLKPHCLKIPRRRWRNWRILWPSDGNQ